VLAGLYNISWGLYSVYDPQWLFRFSGLPLLNHPQIFACLAMVVGLYGIVYFEVARVPERGWLLVSLQLVPLFILGLWSLKLTVVILGFVEVILLALAYMTCGNFLSISHRFQMQFFRFSSGGSPIDAVVGVLFGTVPGAVAILLFGRRLWWVTVAMVIFYSAFYLLSLSWSGKRFNRIIEQT
jgi:hypothetical protein